MSLLHTRQLSRPAAVIFDMDGVLFDTEQLSRRLWREVFERYGIDFSDELFLKLIGRTMDAVYKTLALELGSGLPLQEIFDEQEDLYKETTSLPMPLKPGVHELLDWLREQGIPCAVGSSTNHSEVEDTLAINDLRRYFPVVVGGDYVKHGKPAPDIFLKAAEYLQTEPANCLVIEDSNNGLKAAKAAHIPAIMVPDIVGPDEVDPDLQFTVCNSLFDVRDLLATL